MYIKQTHSTNNLLREMIRQNRLPEGFLVRTDFQTAGKGQVGNSWESEARKNLLFSMVLYPHHVAIDKQFILSQIVSLAIKKALDKYTPDISIKWPNDIYWKDKKIAGILIENSLRGICLDSCVMGIGLNVNQLKFTSNAPNPVSLRQITGRRTALKPLLESILRNTIDLYTRFDEKSIQEEYALSLYRNDGFYPYRADNDSFEARIIAVYADGKLELEARDGTRKEFYFKEVEFIK